jgi:vacuolar-type H+-ATPase subunit F/Vma7
MDIEKKPYSIFIIGDIHSVTAFRIAGFEGYAATRANVSEYFENLISKNYIGILLITFNLSSVIEEKIKKINYNFLYPVIIEIPGVEDTSTIDKSILSYVTEALGIAI